MRERAVRVGSPAPLVGVITEPDDFQSSKPAVLILNSGLMHHIGTCRLSVKLARSLADIGFISIRFDFSSIGDSEARRGSKTFQESAPLEVTEVMDYLNEKRGIKKFILFGLCSGADVAYDTAVLDSRVVGIAQIDPYCYRTPIYYLNHYRKKLFNINALNNFITKKIKFLSKKVNKKDDQDEAFFEELTSYRVFPPLNDIAKGLSQLVDRQVRLNIMFTGGEYHYNYSDQYRDSLKGKVNFRDLLTLNYYPESGHIITQPKYQKLVVNGLTKWIDEVG